MRRGSGGGCDAPAADAAAESGRDAAPGNAADPAGVAQGGLLGASRPGANPFRTTIVTAATAPRPRSDGPATVVAADTAPLPGIGPAAEYGLPSAAPDAPALPPTIYESTDEEAANAALPQLPETVPGQQPGEVTIFPSVPAVN